MRVTIKLLNKMLVAKGLFNYRVIKFRNEYVLQIMPEADTQFSSREILTVRDYIQDMK